MGDVRSSIIGAFSAMDLRRFSLFSRLISLGDGNTAPAVLGQTCYSNLRNSR